MEIFKVTLQAGKDSPIEGGGKGGVIRYTCPKCSEEFVISKGGIVVPLGTLYCLCGERWNEELLRKIALFIS